MEQYDMGDAFVGAWDIANLVSDFLMEKMGAETSGCSTKAPTSRESSGYAAVVVLEWNAADVRPTIVVTHTSNRLHSSASFCAFNGLHPWIFWLSVLCACAA